jgi:hypothetical protein
VLAPLAHRSDDQQRPTTKRTRRVTRTQQER